MTIETHKINSIPLGKGCGKKKAKAETRKMKSCESKVEAEGKSKESAGNICATSLGLNKTQPITWEEYKDEIDGNDYKPHSAGDKALIQSIRSKDGEYDVPEGAFDAAEAIDAKEKKASAKSNIAMANEIMKRFDEDYEDEDPNEGGPGALADDPNYTGPTGDFPQGDRKDDPNAEMTPNGIPITRRKI